MGQHFSEVAWGPHLTETNLKGGTPGPGWFGMTEG